MQRRSLSLITLLLIVSTLPLSASQFAAMSFDQVARESTFIVRGAVQNTWSAWDDAHEVIYTYATVRVSRYFGEATGPDTLVLREVGGTVDGYVMEAVGFPAIRNGEQVVLFLSQWENSTDYRIHAYNEGKYLVRERARDGAEILVQDPVKQGEPRIVAPRDRFHAAADAVGGEVGLTLDEFAGMVDDARAGGATIVRKRQ
jgi:hypothetical protein